MPVGKAAPAQRERVSVLRDNFTQGGVLPEGLYRVDASVYEIFQYQAKDGSLTGVSTVAHHMSLQPMTRQPDGKLTETEGVEKSEQRWSITSDLTAFAPSEDGNYLEKVGDRVSLSKSSNFYISYDALVNAGVPEQKFNDEGCGILVGMIGQITHIPAPDRSAMRQRNQSAVGTGSVGAQAPQKKRDFPETIPVFKSILSAPWDKKGKTAPPAVKTSAPKAAAAPAASTNGHTAEPDNRLAGMISTLIQGANGTMGRTSCRLQCHRTYNAQKVEAGERDAELAVFNDDEQLTDLLASINCYIEDGNIILAQ